MSTTVAEIKSASAMTGRELAEASRMTASQAGPATVKRFVEANKGTMAALLPKHFDAERMLKLALGALRTTPKLTQASNSSLLGAVVTCAQLGLEPNTPLGHAYLLPFDKREKQGDKWVTVETQVQIIVGYKGMLDLARRSGQIVSIAAHEVCQGDEFSFAYGLEEELVHRPAMSRRGDVIGFYAVAKLVGGGHCFEFMSTDEVNHIRDKSAEKNRAKKDSSGRPIITGPWADNYVEMGRKTALRRLFKYLPISIENLAFADAIEGHGIGKAAPIDEMVFDVVPTEDQDDAPAQLSPPATAALEAISAATDLSGITRALSGLKPADKAAVKPYAEARQAEIKSARQPDPQDDALTALEQRGSVDQETGEWTPSPEEMAAIHAREIAEGGGK